MYCPRPRHAIKITGPWALVIGMVCLGIGAYQFLTSRALAAGGIATEAVVVEVDRRHHRSGYEYAVTLEFEDQQGNHQRQRTGYSRELATARAGQQLRVLYNPRDPSELSIDSWASLWWSPILFSLFGAVSCGAFLLAPAKRAD